MKRDGSGWPLTKHPIQWDSNFGDFIMIEKLFHFPVIHFNFHLGQIAK